VSDVSAILRLRPFEMSVSMVIGARSVGLGLVLGYDSSVLGGLLLL
jgi:hypothetical protein